jgi:hypothetical protein
LHMDSSSQICLSWWCCRWHSFATFFSTISYCLSILFGWWVHCSVMNIFIQISVICLPSFVWWWSFVCVEMGVAEKGSSDIVIYACKKIITCCISILQNLVTKIFNAEFWGLYTCTLVLFLVTFFLRLTQLVAWN